jgi:hypothetical protein
MLIIGCDYHPSFEQIAWLNTETGECGNRRLGYHLRRPNGLWRIPIGTGQVRTPPAA